MLNKIQNNNRGDIPLSFVFVIFTLLILCCGFLDLFNVVRLKSVMVKEAQVITAACINQSGFKAVVPQDWKDVYDCNVYNCTIYNCPDCNLSQYNYLTSTAALSIFSDGLENTIADKGTSEIYLQRGGGTPIKMEANNNYIMQHNSSGTLTFSCKYSLKYLNVFGLLTDKLKCEVTNPVVAFWVHKNSQI